MTKIAIPPDLAGMFTACEDAYEQATREGYAENPAVIAACHRVEIRLAGLAGCKLQSDDGQGLLSRRVCCHPRGWSLSGSSRGMYQTPRGNRASSTGTSSVQSVLDTDQSARRLAQITAAGSGRELTMIVGSAIAVRVP